jgi:hypothetical protein
MGEDGDTQDFRLQNHDVFFVDNAKQMCEVTRSELDGERYPASRKERSVTREILKAMQKPESSVLSTYWSVLPYSFGDRYVKYKWWRC